MATLHITDQILPVQLVFCTGLVTLFVLTCSVAVQIVRGVYLYGVCQLCGQRGRLAQRYGQWAVVTGATDGIGQEIALELARRGMSVLAIGRNEAKLAHTRALLERQPNVGRVETATCDLSDVSVANFGRLATQLRPDERDIGVLVNNAGISPAKWRQLHEFELVELVQTASVNMLAPLQLTRMCLPAMIGRGRGLVINVSSLLGAAPAKYNGVYGLSKSFLSRFTRQLRLEYASSQVRFVDLAPGPVDTKMYAGAWHHKRLLPIPGAPEYARKALNAIVASRVDSLSGTCLHGLMRTGLQVGALCRLDNLFYDAFLLLAAKNKQISSN